MITFVLHRTMKIKNMGNDSVTVTSESSTEPIREQLPNVHNYQQSENFLVLEILWFYQTCNNFEITWRTWQISCK